MIKYHVDDSECLTKEVLGDSLFSLHMAMMIELSVLGNNKYTDKSL